MVKRLSQSKEVGAAVKAAAARLLIVALSCTAPCTLQALMRQRTHLMLELARRRPRLRENGGAVAVLIGIDQVDGAVQVRRLQGQRGGAQARWRGGSRGRTASGHHRGSHFTSSENRSQIRPRPVATYANPRATLPHLEAHQHGPKDLFAVSHHARRHAPQQCGP
jgi:hypothetical protein